MYKLPYFTEQDEEKITSFIKQNSFAIIIASGNDFPVATHIPLAVEIKEGERMFLSGHLMKNTDHHHAFQKNENVLVIFNGPHTYVSASWYAQPAVGSTWNYLTAHVRGKIRFTDEAGTYKAVEAITNKYEGYGTPASFDKLPPDYIHKLLKAIVGFEIEVISIENVFKLSQNHDDDDRQNIAEQLRKRGDENSAAIADEIEKGYMHRNVLTGKSGKKILPLCRAGYRFEPNSGTPATQI